MITTYYFTIAQEHRRTALFTRGACHACRRTQVLVYGGLQAFGGVDKHSKKSFFTLLGDTTRRLGEDFMAVGSSEMARLATEAL